MLYEVGFDKELELPWRRDLAWVHREPGLPLRPQANEDPSAAALAEWPDGMTAPMDFTAADRDDRKQTERKRSGGDLFVCTHAENHHKVVVRQRVA